MENTHYTFSKIVMRLKEIEKKNIFIYNKMKNTEIDKCIRWIRKYIVKTKSDVT